MAAIRANAISFSTRIGSSYNIRIRHRVFVFCWKSCHMRHCDMLHSLFSLRRAPLVPFTLYIITRSHKCVRRKCRGNNIFFVILSRWFVFVVFRRGIDFDCFFHLQKHRISHNSIDIDWPFGAIQLKSVKWFCFRFSASAKFYFYFCLTSQLMTIRRRIENFPDGHRQFVEICFHWTAVMCACDAE